MRSDAELLAAAGGDPSAFRELYDRYAERVHGYHLRRSRDADAALDLTAETFAQAWLARRAVPRRGATGRPGRGCSGSPATCCWRRCAAARSSAAPASGSACSSGSTAPPPPSSPTRRWLDGLDEALADLPDGQREAIGCASSTTSTTTRSPTALGTTPRGGAGARLARPAALRHRLTDSTEDADDRPHPRARPPRRRARARRRRRPRASRARPGRAAGAAAARAGRRRRSSIADPRRRARAPTT